MFDGKEVNRFYSAVNILRISEFMNKSKLNINKCLAREFLFYLLNNVNSKSYMLMKKQRNHFLEINDYVPNGNNFTVTKMEIKLFRSEATNEVNNFLRLQ